MSENYPDWGWSDFIPQLIHLGIIKPNCNDPGFIALGQQLYISDELASITISKDSNTVEVEVNKR
jgi:hypothetical protein